MNKDRIAGKQTRPANRVLLELIGKRPDVIEAKVIRTSQVATGSWVEWKCRYGCDGYGQCLVCPPYTPKPEQTRRVLDDYERAILIHFRPGASIKAAMAALERQVFLMGRWKAFGLGAGPCNFCQRCPVPKGPCRHPDRARPSMEACGIDVFTTVRRAGLPISVVQSRDQCPNYYGLLLVD